MDHTAQVVLIRGVYRNFSQALDDANSQLVTDLLTSASNSYLEDVLELALVATPDELAGKSLGTRLFVGLARASLGSNALRAMSPAELLVRAHQLGTDDERGGRLRNIKIVHRSAVGEVRQGKTSTKYFFLMSEGEWRIDFVRTDQEISKLLHYVAETKGIREGTLLLQSIEAKVGHRVGTDIWLPLQERT